MLSIEELVYLAVFLAFAAIVAAWIRIEDPPVDERPYKAFGMYFMTGLIAGVISFWFLSPDFGMPLSPMNWAVIVSSSVGGMSTVKALVNRFGGASGIDEQGE